MLYFKLNKTPESIQIGFYNLKIYFSTLQYEEKNLTEQCFESEITNLMEEIEQKRSFISTDSVIVIISSHGSNENFKINEKKTENIKDFISKFSNVFYEKPKLFFIECCRSEFYYFIFLQIVDK